MPPGHWPPAGLRSPAQRGSPPPAREPLCRHPRSRPAPDQTLRPPFEHGQELKERAHDACVPEAAVRLLPENDRRFSGRQRLLVGASGDERIVDVDDGHDPGWEWNGLARQTIRISGSIPALMMMADNRTDRLQALHA